ncbi:MAG: hypothetical protein M1827_005636 [Pycnora praestabilis]|nr:MAG: hypothetical protein M1827_005636 [Pycnora praestabilis]
MAIASPSKCLTIIEPVARIKHGNPASAATTAWTQAVIHNSTYCNLLACDDRYGTWCCAYDGNCCNSTYNPDFGSLLGIMPSTSGSTTITSAATATLSTSSATSTSTSICPPTAAPASKSNTSTIIGAAVGVPLGVIALAALSLLFFRERKRRMKAESNLNPSQVPTYEAPMNQKADAYASRTYQDTYGGIGQVHPTVPAFKPNQAVNILNEAPDGIDRAELSGR